MGDCIVETDKLVKLHIVTETEAQRWSLRMDAENLARETPGAVVGTAPDPGADVNMFVNYALWQPIETITTAMFTHREREGPLRQTFGGVAWMVDWCFAMNRHTLALLPEKKSSIMWIWPDPRYHRDRLVLGVCGRAYKSGRKRMEWVKDLRAIPGVEVRTTGGKIPAANMPYYYDDLDYLVVIADNEGGPKPVVEALAMGCPVIAPDVGYCWEFPVLRYSTKEELLSIVKGLVIPRDGWKRTARHVAEVHGRLLGG